MFPTRLLRLLRLTRVSVRLFCHGSFLTYGRLSSSISIPTPRLYFQSTLQCAYIILQSISTLTSSPLLRHQYCHSTPKRSGHQYCSYTCGKAAKNMCNVSTLSPHSHCLLLKHRFTHSIAARIRKTQGLIIAVVLAVNKIYAT